MPATQYELALKGKLLGWTIYGPNTSDFPGFYVARSWIVGKGVIGWPYWPDEIEIDGHVVHAVVGCLCRTLAEARECVGQEFTCIGRELGDDPCIVESWL